MQETQYVVYFNEEVASTATHEAINKKEVSLSKPVTYFRLWRVEQSQHDGSVSTHQIVESGITLAK